MMNRNRGMLENTLRGLCVSASIACTLGLSAQSLQAAEAQPNVIAPSGSVTPEAVLSRSVAQMRADDLAHFGVGGLPPTQAVPFRTTSDPLAYAAAKSAAPNNAALPRSAPSSNAAAPSLTAFNITGLNTTQSGGWQPPDTHGASGGGKYCQVVNSQIACYARGGLFSKVLDVSLASFFNYFTADIFDPRIEYDDAQGRWVVYAEAFQEGATTNQFIFYAISKTGSPQAGWWIYSVNMGAVSGGLFWDYGQLGMTQDAIVSTANMFDASNIYQGSALLSWPKARMYNGLNSLSPYYFPLDGTLAPSKVIDQNPNMYLLVAPGYGPPGGSTIEMYTLANAANYPFQILTGPTAVTVPTYTFPPNADQMGTALQLDTLDGRFVNRSTQIGSSVFNAHTVDFSATGGSGFAAPEIYQVDASTGTLTWSNKWFQAGDSDDFNVSVAVEATGGPAPIGSGTPEDIYVTWTSTSPSSYNAEMVVSGERPPYAAIETLGQVCATSPTYYTGFRWGDYSSVDLTATGQAAEAVNEYIEGNTVWGSKICRFKY